MRVVRKRRIHSAEELSHAVSAIFGSGEGANLWVIELEPGAGHGCGCGKHAPHKPDADEPPRELCTLVGVTLLVACKDDACSGGQIRNACVPEVLAAPDIQCVCTVF